MKPSSFATLLIRLLSLYLIGSSLLSSITTFLTSFLTANNFPGASPMQALSLVSGFFGLQMIGSTATIVFALLLYLWSHWLGLLIARGLD